VIPQQSVDHVVDSFLDFLVFISIDTDPDSYTNSGTHRDSDSYASPIPDGADSSARQFGSEQQCILQRRPWEPR
jgi:hypothetical protein